MQNINIRENNVAFVKNISFQENVYKQTIKTATITEYFAFPFVLFFHMSATFHLQHIYKQSVYSYHVIDHNWKRFVLSGECKCGICGPAATTNRFEPVQNRLRKRHKHSEHVTVPIYHRLYISYFLGRLYQNCFDVKFQFCF